MKTTRNIALALALTLAASGSALADVDENGTDISYKGPYTGAMSKSVASDHWVPGSQASEESAMFVREVILDISEMTTAAGPAEEIRDSWEPGFWQDDDGKFRRLF